MSAQASRAAAAVAGESQSPEALGQLALVLLDRQQLILRRRAEEDVVQ